MVRGHPAGAAPGGAGLLRAQPGRRTSTRWPSASGAGARGPGGDRPRPDGRGHARTGGARLLGEALRRARVHHHHRVGDRHADGQHPGGRPGRSARTGSAPPAPGPGGAGRASGPTPICFHPADKVLSEAGLRTAADHRGAHRAGSGFKIAMRDLEIRGAGNLLGRDQSGHIAAVGYDLYVQMVAEAVAEMKGEPPAPPVEVKIDVPADAHLPADYVGRGPAAGGLPPDPGCAPRPRSTTSGPSGRTASGRCRRRPRGCWPWPGCGSSASAWASPS